MTTDIEQNRRQFLRAAVAGAGSVALGACGGGGSVDAAESAAGTGAGTPAPTPAPSPAPTPAPAPSSGVGTYTYQLAPDQALALPAGTTTRIATGAAGLLVQVSPDLPPGRTLSVSGTGEVSIVAAADAPPVDIRRPWVIEVMASPIATIYNRTKGTTYGKTHNGTTWFQCIDAASDGDLIEVSPGAINQTEADCSNYYNGLDGSGMAITKGVTIRNIPGRGRWRLFPAGAAVSVSRSGIVIYAPNDGAEIGRNTITVEGFDLTDQWGTAPDAVGVQMRKSSSPNSWTGCHPSVAFRNFKVGKTAGTSGQGFGGSVEVLLLEDGHVFDCGSGSGQDHNLYLSARSMTLRGIRTARTRGWSSYPAYNNNATLEGHMAKLSAVTGVIEGCCFDASATADQSLMLQMKAGGNWTVRGSLFIDSEYPNVANGAINMCREYAMDGVTPNFEWWAGSEGNSLLFEKNVFVGHYPRPIVWFFPTSHYQGLKAANDPAATTAQKLQSLVVRDNVGMVTSTAKVWMLSGFPGTPAAERPMWIYRDPNGGGSWAARGNTVMEYFTDERGFDDRAIKRYTRSAGPVPATAGSVSTLRFVFPHGYEARADGFGGLG